MKEVIGSVATRRAELGLHPQRCWSKETTKNKRRMVSEEIYHFEESKCLGIAAAQYKQGAWTWWKNTKDRTITWSGIKQMEPKQLGFLIKAVYDILPTPVNLKLWGLSTADLCETCGKMANLKHVLTECQYSQESCMWRQNEILGIIAKVAKMSRETANKISCIKTSILFIKEGNVSKTSHSNRHKPKKKNFFLHMLLIQPTTHTFLFKKTFVFIPTSRRKQLWRSLTICHKIHPLTSSTLDPPQRRKKYYMIFLHLIQFHPPAVMPVSWSSNCVNKKSASDYERDKVEKYASYLKDGEILPIPGLVEAVEPKTPSSVVTDLQTKTLAGLKKETFEGILKTANIPSKYFYRRSFATWDVLLPSEEAPKKLASGNSTTRFFRLQPEYRGKCRIKVTVCNVSMQLSGDVLAVYLSITDGVEQVTKKTSNNGTAYSDYAFIMCLDRGGFNTL